jgi:CIC family chloride channel protein
MKKAHPQGGIPISPSLSGMTTSLASTENNLSKKRLICISALSILVAIVISLIARCLVSLIIIVTNLSFFGSLDLAYHSPAGNHLGLA